MDIPHYATCSTRCIKTCQSNVNLYSLISTLMICPLSVTHTHTHTYTHTHTCTPAPPPKPSAKIWRSGVTARSVSINLTNCTGLDPSFGNVKYVVRYRSSGGQELMAETTASTLEIKGLSAQTSYRFIITCNNTSGQSGPIVSVTATTKAEG